MTIHFSLHRTPTTTRQVRRPIVDSSRDVVATAPYHFGLYGAILRRCPVAGKVGKSDGCVQARSLRFFQHVAVCWLVTKQATEAILLTQVLAAKAKTRDPTRDRCVESAELHKQFSNNWEHFRAIQIGVCRLQSWFVKCQLPCTGSLALEAAKG